MMMEKQHDIEARDSWSNYLELHEEVVREFDDDTSYDRPSRRLRHKKHKKHHDDNDDLEVDLAALEEEQEAAYLENSSYKAEKAKLKAKRKHEKLLKKMYADPGIRHSSVHGMMIDAGSTGSRLHIYEWEPRVLSSHHEIQNAVEGKKLSFPEADSRWTDRLRPGIASFASLPDDELVPAIADYLQPLLDFAKAVLREKEEMYETFPIFLRATAGMRTLDRHDRFRVLGAVRTLFSDSTFCPFYFEDEFARTLSGEEEAIFGWAGINFAMGNLVEESVGAGTVLNPKLTYGALDMGGASTQISFYEPNEDVMANLFKLQIGQGKHWNLYAHSFLYFGLNAARNRFESKLVAGQNDTSRLLDGITNPCLPEGSRKEVRLSIHYDANGEETWTPSDDDTLKGDYQAVLKNDGDLSSESGDFDACMGYAKDLLHLEANTWCDFAHRGECAFNGVAMSQVPKQSEHFGEFLAFSNYHHVWEFLGLKERSSLQELHDATKHICSMSKDEIFEFNKQHAKYDVTEVEDYCFRSSYVFNILRNGYGFEMDEYVTATDVVGGQKVGWALGAMLYEINTFPWKLEPNVQEEVVIDFGSPTIFPAFVVFLVVCMFASIGYSCFQRRQRSRYQYEPVKETRHLLA